ncbi:MAG: FixH family protein [Chlorobiaceae bacterium]|jgi:nitrogen fixation protein FixH|nr:FixH family protein [Chlorobiaceae bacterium]
MKLFLIALYSLFLVAMASGITIAYRQAEGLVEPNYYEKARAYFSTKSAESSSALSVILPDSLQKGSNDILVSISTHGKPLRNAVVTFFVGNLSKKTYDRTVPMKETEPGNYRTTAVIPFEGVWLARVDIQKQQLQTSKKWFIELN